MRAKKLYYVVDETGCIIANEFVCGTPRDFWENKSTCPECAKILVKRRSCSSCGQLFIAGCKIRYVCPKCSLKNCKKNADGYLKKDDKEV